MGQRERASTMELPDVPERQALLEPGPEELTVRGGSEQLAGPLRMRLAVMGPVHRRIAASDVAHDPELAGFIKSQGGDYTFHALRLSCSFRPADDEPFTGCWVGIGLSRADGADGEPPIAWSMEPDRLSQPAHVSKTFTFKAELKLPLAGISGSAARGSSSHAALAFVQAYGELGSEPSWEFRRIPGGDLNGMHQLKLVVRAPSGVPVQGTTSIEANIERRRFGVVKYRVTVPGDPAATAFLLD